MGFNDNLDVRCDGRRAIKDDSGFLAKVAGRRMLPLIDRGECGGGQVWEGVQQLSSGPLKLALLMTCKWRYWVAIGYTGLEVRGEEGLETYM